MLDSELNIKLSAIRQSILKGKTALENEEIEELLTDFSDLFSFTDNHKKILSEKENSELLLAILKAIPSSQLIDKLLKDLDTRKLYEFCELLITTSDNNEITHELLNLIRNTHWLQKISSDEKWHTIIHDLIKNSNYTFGFLFEQRVRDYSEKTLFNVIRGNRVEEYSWNRVNKIVKKYSSSLRSLISKYETEEMHVAFLMENSIEMASLDIACLTSGAKNVMIPANSVQAHISFILNQTKVPIIIASDEKQLAKIKSIKSEVPNLKKVVLIRGKSIESWVISFEEFLSKTYNEQDESKTTAIKINDLTTIMYTSGTTGDPKGIMFSQMNIVYKRFCRALALPKISDKDRYLAFLPLFHTFGRFLELTGSIFWGAEYCFMENPSVETMISNMNLVKPTIFISIPKKWLQIFEAVTARVNIELDSEEEIQIVVNEVTGGKLKWGISAAGFLPSEVFEFFQKYGLELMSGFGMTEATGGISMTPPGEYCPNSLGKELPGIMMKLGEDGELLVKGEYVMMGYYREKHDETFIDEWLPTGDIMRQDKNGFIEIIDRKKEIYKNIKGETVAPQKIENFFRDFENLKQVFLVGDHRPFNTLLIYPNYDDAKSFFEHMDDEQTTEYFSSIIVTVNRFLAPFERIVDFRVIDREFSLEKGELTPKGTYKRRIIEDNFNELIDELYHKDHYSLFLDNTEIKIPNWFLRERGCLSRDLQIIDSKLVIPKLEKELTLEKIDDKIFRIGDFSYKISKSQIDLHEFLINPIYWLGNEELVAFTDEAIFQWYRQSKQEESIKFVERFPYYGDLELTAHTLRKRINAGERSLIGLHLALIVMRSEVNENGLLGYEYFSSLLSDELQEIFKIATYFLDKPIISTNIEVQKKLFLIAIEHSKPSNFKFIFEKYLRLGANLFAEQVITEIVNSKKCLESVDVIDEILNENIQLKFQSKNITDSVIPVLLEILSRLGIRYPTRYEDLRRKLVYIQIIIEWPELSVLAREYRAKMRGGFRKWLGQNESVAVDIETNEEYGWEDVLIFEEDISIVEKKFLFNSISTTPIIREAIFLFSKGNVVRLSSILPRGVWISKKMEEDNAVTFRVSIQTRHQGAFDILLHLNKNRNDEEIRKEVNWLILAGTRHFLTELVEDFGGYWDNSKVWTQKYQPGLNVAQLFTRDVKKDINLAEEKFFSLWPFFIWNASAAYINFWRLTSGRKQLSNPTPDNIIIPSHDYQLGTRFVSLSNRSEFKSFTDLFFNFYKSFIVPIEEKYPFVKRESAWKYIFPGLINAEGENEGIEILNYFLIEIRDKDIEGKEDIILQLKRLLANIKENGYIPKQLYFAIKRFIRWNNLNDNASINAQAKMLKELYDTYNLIELEKFYPETRTRFYLETIFKKSNEEFKVLIRDLCQQQHDGKIAKDEFLKEVSRLQNEFSLDKKETFFIARLSYPHLKPSDSASFINLDVEGNHTANLVVQVEDRDGEPFYIRKPVSPKEISKLYQLFLDANLQVSFKPEHNFVVAVSERGFIIGGLFYSYADNEVVHMEKIVVSNQFRRHGVSETIMYEFFDRMKAEGFNLVTTGFFRPEYFYRFDFKIEKKYSGLVKKLIESEEKRES